MVQKSVASQVEVTAGTKADFQIVSLLGVGDQEFTIEKEVVTEGRHYRLILTPRAGLVPGTRCLQIGTDSKDPRDQVVAVFLQIEPPTKPAGGP